MDIVSTVTFDKGVASYSHERCFNFPLKEGFEVISKHLKRTKGVDINPDDMFRECMKDHPNLTESSELCLSPEFEEDVAGGSNVSR